MEDKRIIINGLEVYYIEEGQGEPVVILHGWGANSRYWEPIAERLAKNNFRVIIPDLPGFGKSTAPREIWGIDEYANFILSFLEIIEVNKFNLIGHSFGGSLAIKITSLSPEKIIKLVLCDAAFIRTERLNFRQKVSKFLTKLAPDFLKKVPGSQYLEKAVYRLAGVTDYYQSNGIMRDILKKVVSEDTSALAAQIKKPCLIVWGENDQVTPLEDGFVLNNLVKGSELKILPEVGHNPYRKKIPEFCEVLLGFLNKN